MGDPAKGDDRDESKSEVHLEETFYILTKKNTVFRVRLTEKGLSLRKECNGSSKEQTILIEDIVGCRCMRSERRARAACACSALPGPRLRAADDTVERDEPDERDDVDGDASAYLYIYAYVLKRGRRGGRRERTTITLRFRSFDRYDDNNREAQKWRACVRALAAGPSTAPRDTRKLLVLLNPKAGAGKAREEFQRRVAPVLAEAEVGYDLHVTSRAGFARDFARRRALGAWRGAVAVGGDGVLFELVNGLLQRPDWREVLRDMPLAVVPCGSGNGLARSVCHLYREPYAPNTLMSSTLALVRGRSAPIDLVRVETKTQIMFSFLSIGWGLLSDIDIESERLRALGGQRFTLWSLARLIGLRTYRGKVMWEPAEPAPAPAPPRSPSTGLDSPGDPDGLMLDSLALSSAMDPENLDSPDSPESPSSPSSPRGRLDSWYSAASRRSTYFSSTGSDYLSVVESNAGEPDENPRVYGPASRLPALTAPAPAHWQHLEGDFIMVHAGYQPFLGEDFLFAPESRLSDGIIYLLVIRGDATRGQLLSFLLGLASGAHARTPTPAPVQLLPVRAFRIEPEPRPTHPAHLTVDGELVAYGPIQAEVCEVAARLMVP